MSETEKTVVTETTTSGIPQPVNPLGEATDPAAVAQNAVANANPATETVKETVVETPSEDSDKS